MKEIDKRAWEHLPKRKKWWERRKLKLRALGVMNGCYGDLKTRKSGKKYKERFSIQFYDYDINGATKSRKRAEIQRILKIFPYDVILYKTKHGIHFISFALLKGWMLTKARATKLSLDLGNQDYWTTGKNLVLRVSSKWRVRYFGRREVRSSKPEFLGVAKKPIGFTISKNHLEFYKKNMDLPDWVYELYNDCEKKDLEFGITHYKTRD